MTNRELVSKFIEKYGEGEPSLFFSPGRVNLIGEHTDYNGGVVLPCALTFGTYCLIRKTKQPLFRFSSLNMDFECDIAIKDALLPLDDKWVNYPLGVIAQFIKRGLIPETGADMLFYGNVPSGAGLSSSAALELSTCVAINEVYGFGLERIDLVKIGQKAEHEFAKVNCGIMDQFASGFGKKEHAIFLDCSTLDYELVPLALAGKKIIISNTNSPHKLDSGKYNKRVAECQAAVEAIKPFKNINMLGDLSWNDFLDVESKIEDEIIRRRARHVVSEIHRTKSAVGELKKGSLKKFGKLMNESHNSLRDNYEVTGNELDSMVDEARKINGVIGSRMTGGGFGGCTVSLVEEAEVDNFIEKVGRNYEAQTGLAPMFYVAETGNGGCRIAE